MAKGTLRVRVLGDTGPFDKAMGGITTTVGKAAKASALAFGAVFSAGAGAALVGKWALGVNTELESVATKSETVFGDSLGVIESWAESSAAAMGLTASEATGLAANMGDLLVPMGFTREEAANMAAETTNLAGALSEWSGGTKTAAEVSDILTKAMLGERDGLKALGISITEAEVSARLLEKGQNDLTGAALEQAKALATQELVMEKSADAQASFAAEGQPLLRMQNELRAVAGEWSDSIATKLQPTIERVASFVSTTLLPQFNNLLDAFNSGDGIIGGLRAAFGELFDQFGDGGGFDFGAMFDGLLEGARSAVQSVIDWLAGGGFETIFQFVIEQRERLMEAAMTLFPALLDAVVEVFPELLAFFSETLIPTVLGYVVSAVPGLLAAGLTLFQSLVDAVLTTLPQLLRSLVDDVLPAVLKAVVGMVPELLEAGIEAFLSLVDAVLDVLPDLVGTLFGDVLPAVVGAIVTMLPDILSAAVTAFLALVDAVLDVLPELIQVLIGTVLPALIDTLVDMIPELMDAGIQVFTALIEAVPAVLPDLVGIIVTDLVPAVIGAVLNLVPQLFQAGKSIIQGLIDGIGSMIGAVGNAIGDVAGRIRGALPFSPAKWGPLSGAGSPDRAGRKIGEMVADGLTSSVGRIRDAASGAAGAAQVNPSASGVFAGRGQAGVAGRSGLVGELARLLESRDRERGGQPIQLVTPDGDVLMEWLMGGSLQQTARAGGV